MSRTPRVYHYSTEQQHVPLLLRSIKPRRSDAGAQQEQHLLWLSRPFGLRASTSPLAQGPTGFLMLSFTEQGGTLDRNGWVEVNSQGGLSHE